MVALVAALIPYETIGYETCESIGFDSCETVVDPARAEVCALVHIGGTKIVVAHVLLGDEEVLPLCPTVVHFSFCFPSTCLAEASLGGDLTLVTTKGQSLILCSVD